MITNQTFGAAIEALKSGKSVSREGWNGKGMLIYLNKGSVDIDTIAEPGENIEAIRGDLFVQGDTGTVTRLPNLNMRAASGSTVTGWLASQTDILSEDWCIHD